MSYSFTEVRNQNYLQKLHQISAMYEGIIHNISFYFINPKRTEKSIDVMLDLIKALMRIWNLFR